MGVVRVVIHVCGIGGRRRLEDRKIRSGGIKKFLRNKMRVLGGTAWAAGGGGGSATPRAWETTGGVVHNLNHRLIVIVIVLGEIILKVVHSPSKRHCGNHRLNIWLRHFDSEQKSTRGTGERHANRDTDSAAVGGVEREMAAGGAVEVHPLVPVQRWGTRESGEEGEAARRMGVRNSGRALVLKTARTVWDPPQPFRRRKKPLI